MNFNRLLARICGLVLITMIASNHMNVDGKLYYDVIIEEGKIHYITFHTVHNKALATGMYRLEGHLIFEVMEYYLVQTDDIASDIHDAVDAFVHNSISCEPIPETFASETEEIQAYVTIDDLTSIEHIPRGYMVTNTSIPNIVGTNAYKYPISVHYDNNERFLEAQLVNKRNDKQTPIVRCTVHRKSSKDTFLYYL